MTRSLPTPDFADDDGSVDPLLAAVLSDPAATAAVLPQVRVFAPVVALRGGEPRVDGGDGGAEMATVLMTGADGRRALLVFSSVAALQDWDPHARPVGVRGADAARAALAEGASALLIDLGGDGFTVLETAALRRLAG